MSRRLLSALLLGVGVSGETSVSSADITPKLSPSSDKKFFGKDYPADKRPKVDVLHFNHPYPVVQDSGDFDADFVKDENNDNGEWRAQTEYDRLRHKLRKEKADVEKALKSKKSAESELEDALQRQKAAEAEARRKAEAAKAARKKQEQKEAEEKAAEKEDAKKAAADKQQKKESKKDDKDAGGMSSGGSSDKQKVEVDHAVKKRTPGGASKSGEVDVAVAESQKAMENLKNCKKQLEETRKKLKDLMKELEVAKKKQEETEAILEQKEEKMRGVTSGHATAEKRQKDQYQQYLDAKAAFEKQQMKVAKMEAEIRIAAEKVRKIRDSEDRNGGVYPSGPRSSAPAVALSGAVVVASALAFIA